MSIPVIKLNRTITVKKRVWIVLPTLKPGPVSVSADCPFSPISVVLLPCSQVSWHWPFRHVRLQMSGAMTTLKRSRVDARSAHRASRWSASQMRSRWERISEGMLASLNANTGHSRYHQQNIHVKPERTRQSLRARPQKTFCWSPVWKMYASTRFSQAALAMKVLAQVFLMPSCPV